MNLKQLSQLLGISQTTISRALNGYPEVNAETRRKIIEAARQTVIDPTRQRSGWRPARSAPSVS